MAEREKAHRHLERRTSGAIYATEGYRGPLGIKSAVLEKIDAGRSRATVTVDWRPVWSLPRCRGRGTKRGTPRRPTTRLPGRRWRTPTAGTELIGMRRGRRRQRLVQESVCQFAGGWRAGRTPARQHVRL